MSNTIDIALSLNGSCLCIIPFFYDERSDTTLNSFTQTIEDTILFSLKKSLVSKKWADKKISSLISDLTTTNQFIITSRINSFSRRCTNTLISSEKVSQIPKYSDENNSYEYTLSDDCKIKFVLLNPTL